MRDVGGRPALGEERAEMWHSWTVRAVSPSEWDLLVPGAPGQGYYRAIEDAPPPHFAFGALTAKLGATVAAVAPTFSLEYRLDTSLQRGMRTVTNWLYQRVPRALSARLLAIGSPLLDNCTLGFAPGLSTRERQHVFAGFLRELDREAVRHNHQILVVKSLDEDQAACLHAPLAHHGYARITCLPAVQLPLPYATFDEYLASLSKKRRANFRQKLRSLKHVRVEFATSIEGLDDKLLALFEATRNQSKGQYNDFDALHPYYFRRAKEHFGEQFQVLLLWRGGELLGMLTLLVGRDRIIARDFGMKYPEGRDLNLYFLAFLKTIEYAIANDIPTFDMGATTYATKLQFGGTLSRRWLYLRFRRRWMNTLLRPAVGFFDFERNDPELRKLEPRQKAERRSW